MGSNFHANMQEIMRMMDGYYPELEDPPRTEECEIYHDEIKDDRKNPVAHGFLIVPLRSKQALLEDLAHCRAKHGVHTTKINFKNLSGTKWHPSYGCARDWLSCLVDGMAKKPYMRRANGKSYAGLLGIRFSALFMKSLSALSDDYWIWADNAERNIRKFETLLRIGLKGGLSYLSSPQKPVVVSRFVTDAGAFHRPLDERRVIRRLQYELDPYIDLGKIHKIESVASYHRNPGCKDADAAHLLQLCDLMLGAVSFTCLKSNHEQKLKVTRRVRELLDKRRRGPGFRNSSHYKTFSITLADINGGAWKFAPLTTVPPNLPLTEADI